MANLPAIGG